MLETGQQEENIKRGKITQTLDSGTLPRRPASQSHLFTVDAEIGVLLVLFNETVHISCM
jgi:hypothetical protein